MLTYNTHLKKLVLPEYGRNIQRMVDHCLSIEDREARQAAAQAIIDTMATLFPAQGNQDEHRRKLWDHLAIMSGYALDIDWPYGPVSHESRNEAPGPIPLPYTEIRHRLYGNALQRMVDAAVAMPPSPERDSLAILIANQMKKLALAHNPDTTTDGKILSDLRHMSHGAFDLEPQGVVLLDYFVAPPPSRKKRKKKNSSL